MMEVYITARKDSIDDFSSSSVRITLDSVPGNTLSITECVADIAFHVAAPADPDRILRIAVDVAIDAYKEEGRV